MANFNPYIDKIDMDFWRELCAKEGKLCLYKKGDYFLHCGDITRNRGELLGGRALGRGLWVSKWK